MMNRWMLPVCLALAANLSLAQGNSDKTVNVTVNGAAITANPDPVAMSKQHNKLRWELKSSGYTFADNGIVIQGNGGDYGDCGIKGKDKRMFECKKLKHADGKRFKYDINLLNAAGQSISVDPVIQND
ncbi:hypothetical protein WG899_20095 [Paucibacter sp. AS339]|uniref:hypothetical protein n=1 Tax=Paucibacter hankyongi TaxID=3133434 RepID=UPI0030B28810